MPEASADVLIVGAGPAGAACAETLREEGFDGSILLAGREPDPPYHRPPASKDYLAARMSREDCLLHPPRYWEEQGIDLRTRAMVMRLDPARRVARVGSDDVRFDRALLAPGANVRRLRVDGAALEGIHHLRTLGNADAIRADAEGAERVVLVGGSFIACEVAATLTALGKRCTLVMLEEHPLSGPFGDRVGEWVGERLRERGVELLGAESVARFDGPEGGRVDALVTESGRRVETDMVVVGAGASPDVTLARSGGLELAESGGIACDATLRTSAAGIWAAGDACDYDSALHGRRVRVEHWEVARAQGRHVARAMLGGAAPFSEVPYFWSDLADWATLEYVGAAPEWDREVVRGSMDAGDFTVLYLEQDRVVAALAVGRSEELEAARGLVARRAAVAGREQALADPSTDLAGL